MKWNRRDWVILLSITLLAALLRFYKLGQVPLGFQFDEAFNAIDAEQVWHGNRPLFLPANGGREAFYTYYQALLGTFLGFNVYTLRLASALAGIATIPATYWLLRTLLRRHARPIALFTSLSLAISLWHLHFSHYGIRVIMMPLILSGLFGCYWLALHAERLAARRWALIGSGLLTGLTVWTHPSGRFVPFILLAYTLWLLWRHPQQRRLTLDSPMGVLAVTGVIAFLVFLPLGIEFYRHPDFFFGHASEVSIFAERVSGDTPWLELLRNIGRVLGMFTWHGDIEWAHNLAGRPVFDPLLSIPFLLGVGVWIVRLSRRKNNDPNADPDVDALVLLALWAIVMVLPSILSEAAPNYSRTLPALPAVFVTVGLGLSWLAIGLPRWRWLPAWSGSVLAGLLLVSSGLWASYDYFIRFPNQPPAYYIYDADKLDALAALEALAAEGNKVYLQPLWASHATFTFLRDSNTVKSLDTAETLVLPPVGSGAVYAFPSEKLDAAAHLAQVWPGIQAEELLDRYNNRLLALVKVPPDLLAGWPAAWQPTQQTEIRFDDAPTLLGLQSQPGSAEIVLFWRAEGSTFRNLTTFLHFMDADGRRVAQIDKLPGNGSYMTPAWSPGERVIERYQPEVGDVCAGGDTVDVVVGWYELAADGARRPRLDGTGDSAVAGQVTLPIRAYAQDMNTLPNSVNLALQAGPQLVGYTIQTGEAKAGAPFVVDLYWAANAALNEQAVIVQLLNGDDYVVLWNDVLAPDTPWAAGETICRRLHMQLPDSLTPGNYLLDIANASETRNFATVAIKP